LRWVGLVSKVFGIDRHCRHRARKWNDDENEITIEIEANDYIDGFVTSANISTRKGNSSMPVSRFGPEGGSISSLIASLGEGISPTVMDAMKMLVNCVLDSGPGGNGMRRNDETL